MAFPSHNSWRAESIATTHDTLACNVLKPPFVDSSIESIALPSNRSTVQLPPRSLFFHRNEKLIDNIILTVSSEPCRSGCGWTSPPPRAKGRQSPPSGSGFVEVPSELSKVPDVAGAEDRATSCGTLILGQGEGGPRTPPIGPTPSRYCPREERKRGRGGKRKIELCKFFKI